MTLEMMEKRQITQDLVFCSVGFQQPKKRENFEKRSLAVRFFNCIGSATHVDLKRLSGHTFMSQHHV